MNQSRIESLVEQVVNLFFKFWVALACWMWFIPLLWPELKTPITAGGGVTLVFTALSLSQGYFWRRVFNGINLHKLVHNAVSSWAR